MPKNFLAFLLSAVILCICQLPAQAAPNNRWHYLQMCEGDNIYVDMQTADYDEQNKALTFWLGFEQNGKFQFMRQIRARLDIKKYNDLLFTQISDSGYAETQKRDSLWERIIPDNFIEKACDDVCDKFKINRIHPDDASRWKWLTSTDKYTVNYATDQIEIDNAKKTVSFWVQHTSLDGRKSDAERYVSDLNNQTVEYFGPRGYDKKIVYPDSFIEIVWNKALSLYNHQ